MRVYAKISTISLVLAAALSVLLASARPATARMDQSVVSRLSSQRDVLLKKERNLNQDLDDLQHQIRDLQRDSGDPRLIDDLCRQADFKSQDLRMVRYDIKRIEVLML